MGSSSTTSTVDIFLLWLRPPFGVVPASPFLAHGADRHSAQCVPRGGMDQGEVEVSGQERERDVHQSVVEEHRAREAEARVLLAEPEQEPGDTEEDRECGGECSVDLLARVEPSLRGFTGPQPAQVIAVERLQLTCRAPQPAKAEHDDDRERGEPADSGPEVHALDQLPPRYEDR